MDISSTTTLKKRKTKSEVATPTKKVKLDGTLKKAAKNPSKPILAKRSRSIRKIKKPTKIPLTKYPLIRREIISENHFYLNNKKWSSWQPVISQDSDLKNNNDWKPEGSYYRKKAIFTNDPGVPSLYEFSVQTRPRCKRYVVYNKMAHRVSGQWERRLFAPTDIKRQVCKIGERGCSLFVTRLPLSSAALERETTSALRRYDYSWRRIRNERKNHRQVELSSKIISDEDL